MEVIGPDSFASVERVPVAAASSSRGTDEVSANTAPAIPMVPRRSR